MIKDKGNFGKIWQNLRKKGNKVKLKSIQRKFKNIQKENSKNIQRKIPKSVFLELSPHIAVYGLSAICRNTVIFLQLYNFYLYHSLILMGV